MRFNVNSHFVDALDAYQAQVLVRRIDPLVSEVESITLTFAQRHADPGDAVAQAEDAADKLRSRSDLLKSLFDQLPRS